MSLFLTGIAWSQQQSSYRWYFGAGGGYSQSLFYCGSEKQKLNSSFTSRDSYFFQLSAAKDLCNVAKDQNQFLRIGANFAYKRQNAYFYYEQKLDTIVPTGTEQGIGVLHLNVFPQWVFGDEVRFLFYIGPNLEYVVSNSSQTVQIVKDERLHFEKKRSDQIKGFSVGGTLGIGVEVPLSPSLCLSFQNSYTSGYTSKAGSMKNIYKYYNCFDINLLLSLIYTVPVGEK